MKPLGSDEDVETPLVGVFGTPAASRCSDEFLGVWQRTYA